MTSNSLVSTIIIFLNADQFLGEAVRSVLRQTYGDFEIILVDDGSSDDSRPIAERFSAEHPQRVRCVEHPGGANRGMSASRNLGIRHARGEYLAFLDVDDVWLPEKLERHVAILDNHPQADLVCGNTLYWHNWPRNPSRKADTVVDLGVATERLYYPPVLFYRLLSGAAVAPCLCSLLARRQIIDDVGGFEDHFRGMYEDQVLWSKLLLQASVYVAAGTLEKYRQHDASTCHIAERQGSHRQARGAYLDWLSQYVNSQGMSDTKAISAVARARWRWEHPWCDRWLRRLQRALRRLRRSEC